MAPRYDVAARLAEARDAVARTQTYVTACRRLGYRHPDLTGYDGQLLDHYDGHAGMDLRALDADCAALGALAQSADDALHQQRRQLDDVGATWRGAGAASAVEFLRGYCDDGAVLSGRLREVAARYTALRDELWRLVDDKAAAVQAVDEQVGTQRPVWLAAAHAVNEGIADDQAAAVIRQHVMPYVDSEVRGRWWLAVRSAAQSTAAAYAAAARDVAAPGIIFAIPGDFAPASDSPMIAAGHQAGAPAPPYDPYIAVDGGDDAAASPPDLAPAGRPDAEGPSDAGAPVAAKPPAAAAKADDSAPAAAPGSPADLGIPAGLGLPSGGLPGGLPGGGLGGLGGWGGLIPQLADSLADPGIDGTAADHRGVHLADHLQGTPDSDDPGDGTPDDGTPDSTPDDGSSDGSPDSQPESAPQTAAGTPGQIASTDAEVQPPAQRTGDITGAPAHDAVPKTPCQIAAEELPQVGQ